MNCEFCNNVFSNLGSLNYHKNNTKYCLLLQGKTLKSEFKCIGCEKIFSRNFELSRHLEICNKNIEVKFKSELRLQKETYEKIILKQKEEFSEVKDKYEKQIKELQDKLENIAIQSNTDKQLKIQHLTKKYVKKVPRVQYEEKNVIYIITTDRLKKDNIYILGKATNLTSRLSTYNKSDEHEVIYYQECSGDSMPIVENMVFNKLEEYRQSANRERFVLPEELKVDVFIDVIKNSINFFSNR